MLRVLVVDDDLVIVKLLREALDLSGFHVSTATNGLSAMEILKKEDFDILITDCEMPGMDGVRFTSMVRSISPGLIIIGMSCDDKKEDFLKAGADLFILKPFSLGDILNVLKDFSG